MEINQIQYISIDKLELLEKNPRKITENKFKTLKKSIKNLPKFFEKRWEDFTGQKSKKF